MHEMGASLAFVILLQFTEIAIENKQKNIYMKMYILMARKPNKNH